MLERFDDPAPAAAWCADVRASGASLGFVPTMGALHEGHLGLVRTAKAECARVCVSVFVNPLQFDDPRDFERYPRDLDGDARMLASAGCDMVFTGTLEQFFPESGGQRERIAAREPGPTSLGLEGAFRPGHFAGVATIVHRLFEVVRPTKAYFGHKDFQQTLVVRHVAAQLGYPEIVVCPTARETSGLARSSRNVLLSEEQRDRASVIYRALREARRAWQQGGERDAINLARRMRLVLAASGLEIEYAEVRDPKRWTENAPAGELKHGVALIAARAGSVRLIDNMRLDGKPQRA